MARFGVLAVASLFVLAASQDACIGAECASKAQTEVEGSMNLLQSSYAIQGMKASTNGDDDKVNCASCKGGCIVNGACYRHEFMDRAKCGLHGIDGKGDGKSEWCEDATAKYPDHGMKDPNSKCTENIKSEEACPSDCRWNGVKCVDKDHLCVAPTGGLFKRPVDNHTIEVPQKCNGCMSSDYKGVCLTSDNVLQVFADCERKDGTWCGKAPEGLHLTKNGRLHDDWYYKVEGGNWKEVDCVNRFDKVHAYDMEDFPKENYKLSDFMEDQGHFCEKRKADCEMKKADPFADDSPMNMKSGGCALTCNPVCKGKEKKGQEACDEAWKDMYASFSGSYWFQGITNMFEKCRDVADETGEAVAAVKSCVDKAEKGVNAVENTVAKDAEKVEGSHASNKAEDMTKNVEKTVEKTEEDVQKCIAKAEAVVNKDLAKHGINGENLAKEVAQEATEVVEAVEKVEAAAEEAGAEVSDAVAGEEEADNPCKDDCAGCKVKEAGENCFHDQSTEDSERECAEKLGCYAKCFECQEKAEQAEHARYMQR